MISQLVELNNGTIGVIVKIRGEGEYTEYYINTKYGQVQVYSWDFVVVDM